MGASRYTDSILALYGAKNAAEQLARYGSLLTLFETEFGAGRAGVRLFSAPGRSEIGGNHTDHQHGRVLACAVTLDLIAAVRARSDGLVRIRSLEYPELRVSVSGREPVKRERGTSMAFVRGVAAYLASHGYGVGGFDAIVMSSVPKGSGLSSSAAYSVLIGTVLSGLYNGGAVPYTALALAGQYAENVFFGKPSGLMDQLACAAGGMTEIDFQNPEEPAVMRLDCDLSALGYAIVITNTRGSHAKLVHEYASIPQEMGLVSAAFHKAVLRDVPEQEFYAQLPKLRGTVPDRALLRAMHFFAENARVPLLADALRNGDAAAFLRLVNESGQSSMNLLQNVNPAHEKERSLALALALSERMLTGSGAWRVHGGGFAGTIQAVVPLGRCDAYVLEMERVFGEGCCYPLAVRNAGGVEIV